MKEVYTGNDNLIIKNKSFKDLANGKVIEITIPEDISKQEVGKNGVGITTYNVGGNKMTCIVRALAGGDLDNFLNTEYNAFKNDPVSYQSINCSFVKKLGDGKGGISKITYEMEGGVIKKLPVSSFDVSGDIEQAVATWEIQFIYGTRKRS